MRENKQGGQVLLIVILVMVVTLTVGLSVITRSITTIRTSKEEANSQRALAAAEAGIEQLIKKNTPFTIADSFDPKTTYTASSTEVLGTSLLVHGGNIVAKDEGADIWLVSHNADGTPNLSSPWSGNLTIFWGNKPVSCNNAALEIIVVYDPPPHKFKRFAFDPCSSRRTSNNFSSASGGGSVSGKSFSHSTSAIVVTSGFVARVVPLYENTPIGVVASLGLPSQGLAIDSTGESSGTSRKIKVFKGYPQLPIQYFSYGLFSP